MKFLQAGYGIKNGTNFRGKETLDARFGNRIRLIFIRNSCFIRINSEKPCEYKYNTLFISSSGMKIEWGSLDDGQIYIDDWVEFSAEEQELAGLGLKAGMVVSEIPREYAKALSKRIRSLALEQFNAESYYQIATEAELKLLLIDLSRYVNSTNAYSVNQNRSHPYFQTLFKMREKLLNNVFDDCSVEQVCKEMGMSVSHFRRLYKEIFNNSVNKDILARKVDIAQKMIEKNPNESILKIAGMLGSVCKHI